MELSKMTAMEAKLDAIMNRMDKRERKVCQLDSLNFALNLMTAQILEIDSNKCRNRIQFME